MTDPSSRPQETALVVSADERLALLIPLLASCGVKADFLRPSDLVPPTDRRYRLAILSGFETGEQWTEALGTVDRSAGGRVIAVVPEGRSKLVVDLYRAGADVVFTDTIDHYHVFLQCTYFLDVWATEAAAGRVGEAVFEPEMRRLVLPNQVAVRLTEAESRILSLLVENRDAYVGRHTISETVFNIPYDKFDRRIDVHISNLRKKMRDAALSAHIDTSRLNGFRLVESSGVSARAFAG